MAIQVSPGTRFKFAQASVVFTLSLVLFVLIAWKNTSVANRGLTKLLNSQHNEQPWKEAKVGGAADSKMAARQKERIQMITKYCATHYQPLKEIDFSNFVVLEDEKVIYCSIPKVACSTWKRILANVQGLNISTTQGIHLQTREKFQRLSQFSPEEQKEKLATYTKFFFVREPYERLLSAYRDCFYGRYKSKQEYWKNYVRFIRETLGKDGIRNKTKLAGQTLTFGEFITYLDLRRNNEKKFQEHWRPQNELCHPCYVQYDIVGHYETFLEDTRYIYSKTNFGKKAQLPHWHPSSTGPLLKEYYSKVSRESIHQVTNLYKPDFQLFGYWFPSSDKPVQTGF